MSEAKPKTTRKPRQTKSVFSSRGKTTKKSASKETAAEGNEDMKEDSNASRVGVKSRVTFLVGQYFRGVYYEKGKTIDIPTSEATAYRKRSTLKIESID